MTGIVGADKYMCTISKAVNSTLEELNANYVVALANLSELRKVLHVAIDTRISELELSLSAAMSSKSTLLESQLIAVDKTLEIFRTTDGDPSRRCEFETQAMSLQTRPVTLPDIFVETNSPELLKAIGCFGAVIAPPAVLANDVLLLPPPASVRPGATISLTLRLGDSYPPQGSGDGTAIALTSLKNRLHVEAVLVPPELTSSRDQLLAAAKLPLCLSINAPSHAVEISVPVPLDATLGSLVKIRSLEVAGHGINADGVCIIVERERRFWRVCFTESSETGWEAYVSNLSFLGPRGIRVATPIVRCWSRVQIDPFDSVTRLRPELALRRTNSHEGAYRTMYSPGINRDFIAVELVSPEDICGVAFDQFAGPGNAITFITLEGSVDGEDWHEVLRSPVRSGIGFRVTQTMHGVMDKHDVTGT